MTRGTDLAGLALTLNASPARLAAPLRMTTATAAGLAGLRHARLHAATSLARRLGGSLLLEHLLAGLLARQLVGRLAIGVRHKRVRAAIDALGAREIGHKLAHEGLDVSQVEIFRLSHKSKRPAKLTGTARTADTVDVVLGVTGHVEVHHVGNLGNVDAASEHISGHQHVGLTIGKAAQCRLALALGTVAVDGGSGNAGLVELAAHHVGAILAAAEHDNALGALTLEHVDEDADLLLLSHAENVLVDGLRCGALVGDFHTNRILDQLFCGRKHIIAQSGREQQRLARGRRLGNDAAHGGCKAHVEHAVGLVEHQDRHVGEVGRTLVDKVDETARRGDEHVAATGKSGLLRLVAHATHNDSAAMPGLLADDTRASLNLLSELTGGGHNEHEHALALGGMAQAIERGKQERGRFAGAGLSGGHDVAALEHCGDGAALHGRRLLVAHLGNGGENLLGQSELVKAGYFVGVHVQTSNLCPANAKPGGGKVPGTPRLQGRMGCGVRKRRGEQAALGTFPGARPLRKRAARLHRHWT